MLFYGLYILGDQCGDYGSGRNLLLVGDLLKGYFSLFRYPKRLSFSLFHHIVPSGQNRSI